MRCRRPHSPANILPASSWGTAGRISGAEAALSTLGAKSLRKRPRFRTALRGYRATIRLRPKTRGSTCVQGDARGEDLAFPLDADAGLLVVHTPLEPRTSSLVRDLTQRLGTAKSSDEAELKGQHGLEEARVTAIRPCPTAGLKRPSGRTFGPRSHND